jgi:hypothetical protein
MSVGEVEAWSSFCFPVLFSGCDVNSPRQPGADGEGEEEARDGQTPLHLAASWGLEETVQCLLEFGANVNAQVCSFSFPERSLVTHREISCDKGPYRLFSLKPLLYHALSFGMTNELIFSKPIY